MDADSVHSLQHEGSEYGELDELMGGEEEEEDIIGYITKEQLKYYRVLFESIDTSKKERIPTKSIAYVLRVIGYNPSKAELKKFYAEVDPNNLGTIGFDQFLIPIGRMLKKVPETHLDVIAAFRVLDPDNFEYLTTSQLWESLTLYGEELEDFEFELLLKTADPKATGRVNYVDFVEKMMGIPKKKPPKQKKADKKKKKEKKSIAESIGTGQT